MKNVKNFLTSQDSEHFVALFEKTTQDGRFQFLLKPEEFVYTTGGDLDMYKKIPCLWNSSSTWKQILPQVQRGLSDRNTDILSCFPEPCAFCE